MNILDLLLGASVMWGCVAAEPPSVDVVAENMQPSTDEVVMTRPGAKSSTYHFPNPALRVKEGTTIEIFGVKTSGGFTLQLYPAEDNPNPEPFNITKFDKGWKVQYKSASKKYVGAFDMSKDRYVWFIVENTNDYLALYGAWEEKPLLTASNKLLKTKLNFNSLERFRVSSEEKAQWDFLGYKYDKEEAGSAVQHPFLDPAVQKVKKSYQHVSNHLKRCGYADANRNTAQENNARFFLTMFFHRNCGKKKTMVQLRDMEVRYRAILQALGVHPPPPPTDKKCKEFIMDRRSLRL